MMSKKRIALIVFILSVFQLNAQKDIFYFDDNLINITEKEYQSIIDDNIWELEYDMDTIVARVAVKKIKRGKLNSNQYNALKYHLTNGNSETMSFGNKIVIDYHPGKDNCLKEIHLPFIYNLKAYQRKIKRLDSVSQFFVHTSGIELDKSLKFLYWIEDKNRLIENLFFPLHYPCGGFTIIESSGDYFSYRGEYSFDSILNIVKDKKDKWIDY